MERRNIVLITMDSLRADHCSFMGYYRETTPNLDKMAQKGIYFRDAIVPGAATPVSMFGIFTGSYCPLDPEEKSFDRWRKEILTRITLAEKLKLIGYKTCAFSPNPRVSRYYGFNKGFQYFNDFIEDFKSKDFHFIKQIKMFVNKKGWFRPWTTYYNDILEWVEKQKSEFFLWIFLIDTHHPYFCPMKYRKYSSLWDAIVINWKAYRQYKTGKNFLDINDKTKVINVYDDSIRFADKFLGRIKKDLADYDPIFIVHSDHGEAFWEHGFYGHTPPEKTYLYRELLRVPLVVYNADCEYKGEIEKPVTLLDLSKFILELVKRERDPIKVLTKRDIIVSKVFTKNEWKIAIQIKNYKFIYGQKRGHELFDLKRDPFEQQNLVSHHPELVNVFLKIVNDYLK